MAGSAALTVYTSLIPVMRMKNIHSCHMKMVGGNRVLEGGALILQKHRRRSCFDKKRKTYNLRVWMERLGEHLPLEYRFEKDLMFT